MNSAHKGLLTKLTMLLEKKSGTINTCGARCTFVPLTAQWGAKLYAYSETRDICHTMQLKAHRKHVAPRVGAKFELENGNKKFGYLTQIAVLPFKHYDEQGVKTVSLALHDKMYRRGFTSSDLHGWNIGKIGEAYVCIDFDHVYEVKRLGRRNSEYF